MTAGINTDLHTKSGSSAFTTPRGQSVGGATSTTLSKPVSPASAALHAAYAKQIRSARQREPPGPGAYSPTNLDLPAAPRLMGPYLT